MTDQGFNKTQIKQLEGLFDKNREERRDDIHQVVESLSGVIQKLDIKLDKEVERLESLIKTEAKSTRDEISALSTTSPTVYQVNNHEVRIGRLEKKVFKQASA